MANSLLDFVISLVRDPDAAARYAVNPAKALADAHLTDVTSADVNNLIPVVTDSLSMGAAGGTAAGQPVAEHGNVWESGAAAAALDAFTPHTPSGTIDPHGWGARVIHQSVTPATATPTPDRHPHGSDPHGISPQFTDAVGSDSPVEHGGLPPDDLSLWDHPVPHPHPGDPEHHDFGLHG
ncbi:Rv0340 family IniB-related protein [Mycobacterium sherrisii]|uniref:Rv0340 family IniB-related protein n=1 Tax=Mycobacterium sherrisii TaxID=243061 RepID=UPI000A1464AD|nr:IniB N-terminal domain-containing protein [Mycobacterium sherrisii]MCV7028454.1 hypothetical protein [Mycobacterium sherrisii]MEC4764074.1 Rv0340 family IniB-related protein [Mycobacterium sherrisii]ORW76227.1 hypothetical protein AWC25_12105 [Mycobacterium sherrisii]